MGKELNEVLNPESNQISTYQSAYDEMFKSWADFKNIRPHYQYFANWLRHKKPSFLEEKQALADLMFKKVGITFSVYHEDNDADTEANSLQNERTIPFDVLPRILSAQDWSLLEKGIKQRILALNLFLHDVYHQQHILKNNPILAQLVLKNKQYHPEMQGIDLPKNIYSHVAGVDIIRDQHGQFLVLEDNLRVPSGVSYMLENRRMMMRLFPDLFATQNPILPVAHYPDILRQTLLSVAPAHSNNKPVMVVLTPGAFNSAYFEHAFLAQQLGAELVEGKDLLVRDFFVYMRTTEGLKKVDIIYRRIDDDYLDPIALNPKTNIGVAGLMMAYRLGHVNIVNAIGTGVADDKSIYPFVPDMIRFYLNQDPILNNVETYRCFDDKERDYVLNHLDQLVVKEVHGAGGYGMLIGPTANREMLESFRLKIKSNPGNYIAQPVMSLSTNPTLVEQGIAPRHIDLRPFVLSGEEIHIVPGGLTRVALKEGSLVVNSSQGGGTKDTWVLAE
jgi:uncharacterized circularly permuted ATP-grasp superfamily protein